jgi:phage tail sheath gpL-like
MTIRITGVAYNFRTPGGYGEIIFAQGPANAALGPRTAIVVGPKMSTGTATANVLYAVPDEGTIATLAGSGSPPHRLARKYLAYGGASALSACLYTPTTGTAASKSFAITGTPTKRGNADAQVCDALPGIREVLVAGSRTAQADFKHYVEKHRPAVGAQIVGYETVDHPSDNQLVALARAVFLKHDRMAGVPTPT